MPVDNKNRMTPSECRNLVDATIRIKARVLVAYKNRANAGQNSPGGMPVVNAACERSLPYGLEEVRLNDDGSVDMSDLASKIRDDIIQQTSYRYDDSANLYLVGIREIGLENFTPAYVRGVIESANLEKSLLPAEIEFLQKSQAMEFDLAKAKHHRVIRTKDHRTGEMVDLKIPNYEAAGEDDKAKDGAEGADSNAKNSAGDPNSTEAGANPESHVGRKVYFNPAGAPVLSGRVTGHGEHGITIRDPKGKKHLIEHGKYQVHSEDKDTGD
jgi:hypothetical protein